VNDEPDPVAIKTLAGIVSRVAARITPANASQSVILGVHYDYGAWGTRSFRTDLLAAGSPLKQKVWRLYKMLSETLPPYVQFEATPNELAGPKLNQPGISDLWHDWYQQYFLSAIQAGNPKRFVWLTPPNNWEIARLISSDGVGFSGLYTVPSCGRLVHDYTGLNPGVNPTTFTIPESELEGALMNSFIDLRRWCSLMGETPFLGECFGFDFRNAMPDRARALRYMDIYARCAAAVGIEFSGFHADMIVGSVPGHRALPLAANPSTG